MKKILLVLGMLIPVFAMSNDRIGLSKKQDNPKHRNEGVPPVDCTYDNGVLSVKIIDDSDRANLKIKDAHLRDTC